MPNDVTVDLGNEYIGSAYSPQVEITETPTGHEIAITHASPDGGGQLVTDEFFVPNYSGEEADREAAEAAREAAEAERAAAESARDAAEDARQSAESERASAESARDAAETERASAESARAAAESARATAEQGRASAESARVSAEQARAAAETARESASATAVHNAEVATAAAQSATTAAQSATSAATTATTNANAATAAANTATTNAQSATSAAQAATTAANTAAQTANTAAAAADTAREGIQDDLADMRADIADKAFVDAYARLLTTGAADGIKGGGPTVDATFLHRVTGGGQASDGPATIEVVRGNTVRWNQLNNGYDTYFSVDGLTKSEGATGGISVTGTVTTTPSGNALYLSKQVPLKRDGRKYLFKVSKPIGYPIMVSGYTASAVNGQAFIWSKTDGTNWNGALCAKVESGDVVDMTDVHMSIFDLTQMFGAGSEPSTVEEFEALYPEPYYPYDPGSLLPVRMEGVETVGFNQWDEQWESGLFANETGAKYPNSNYIRSKTPIPCFPSTTYSATKPTAPGFHAYYYDAGMSFISHVGAIGLNASQVQFTTPANARYMNFCIGGSSAVTTYNHDICIYLSGPRNGEYEPYWQSERVIPAATYFPDGVRSAGSFYDELTNDAAVTRVGECVVDGVNVRVQITTQPSGSSTAYRVVVPLPAGAASISTVDMRSAFVASNTFAYSPNVLASAGWVHGEACLYNYNVSGTTMPCILLAIDLPTGSTANEWLQAHPFTLHYPVNPTSTPIDPPLNMSYRAAHGGTETVLVPTGEMSAPVPMVVVYGSTPDGILDRSASLLAAADGPTATAYHAVGSYLTMNGTLYRVTTAIAVDEAVVPGTNVTATTVMAEVLSLIQ